MSVYSLDSEERQSVEDIFKNVDQLVIADELKKKLNEYADTVIDQITDYMKDEYVLRFEEIAHSQARKIVVALLKGESLHSFGLGPTTVWHTPDKAVSYDTNGIRKLLISENIESIRSAEITKLEERLAKSEEDNERYRARIYAA